MTAMKKILNFLPPVIGLVFLLHVSLTKHPATVIRDFKAVPAPGKVNIEWKATSGSTGAVYIVEKSTDRIHYSAVDSINAVNNAKQEYTYKLADTHTTGDTVFYRIAFKEQEQAPSLYKAIATAYTAPKNFEVLYANIGTDNTRLRFCVVCKDEMEVRVHILSNENEMPSREFHCRKGNNTFCIDDFLMTGTEAYTVHFSDTSGNAELVRISSKQFAQVE